MIPSSTPRARPGDAPVPPRRGIQRFAFDGFRGEAIAQYAGENLEEEAQRLIHPGAALRSLHWGRNYLYVARFQSPGGPADVVVKQFRGTGLKARLRRRWRGTKAERSFRVAITLREAGVPTPEPVLLVESSRPDGPSFYVCRYLEDIVEARYLLRAMNSGEEAELFPDIDPGAFLRTLGRLVRHLHDCHCWHRDMTSGNVLIRVNPARRAIELYLVDLNRARMGPRLSKTERIRDLCRMPIFRPEHQGVFLASYWNGLEAARGRTRWLYLVGHHGFRFKNRSKQGLRGGARSLRDLLAPRRRPHVHIAPPKREASRRDKVVWDPLSDQPHQHAGRIEKLAVRLADSGRHLRGSRVVLGAVPRIMRRYRELKKELYRHPTPWDGMGICVRPQPENLSGLLTTLEGLGVHHTMLRLHPWEKDSSHELELARELHSQGFEVAFAIPQNRALVRDPARWRAVVEEIGERFSPYGRHFQVGQAVNRSKWGVWTPQEYLDLVASASEILRRSRSHQPQDGGTNAAPVEILGPAVIDFEYYSTALLLNVDHPGVRFDAVSSLLYVDRRGAPENRQAGFDTVAKVLLLKAIAETSRHSTGRSWITEVNWPLQEGPHSPAGRDVAVDEETQADYLVRYYLLTLGTGLVERVYWWQLVAKGYGLVDVGNDGVLRPRPSHRAFANLRRQLEGCRFLGPISAPRDVRLYRFRHRDAAELIVGWSTSPGASTVTFERPVAQAFNRDGGSEAGSGEAAVSLTGSPAYFVLERD